MGLPGRIRSAITGRFVNTNEADAAPDTTVRERTSQPPVYWAHMAEIRVAAEAVILGAGFPVEGRVEVNQADLDRLKQALPFEAGQP